VIVIVLVLVLDIMEMTMVVCAVQCGAVQCDGDSDMMPFVRMGGLRFLDHVQVFL
jgi:hypothetical protein